MNGVFDTYLVNPELSLLDKTRLQAQVLVPALKALRAELGKDKADAIVKQALRDWSSHIASASDGEVTLDRAQTIMRGAPSCTFRSKFAPR